MLERIFAASSPQAAARGAAGEDSSPSTLVAAQSAAAQALQDQLIKAAASQQNSTEPLAQPRSIELAKLSSTANQVESRHFMGSARSALAARQTWAPPEPLLGGSSPSAAPNPRQGQTMEFWRGGMKRSLRKGALDSLDPPLEDSSAPNAAAGIILWPEK